MAIRTSVQSPVSRPRPRGISRGPQPRPYSPEYGAAPVGRCLKIPAKRPFQIETNRFDLKRRSRGNLAGIRPKAGYRPFTRATTRFPLAVSFPHFFSAKRNGVARRRNAPVLSPSPPQRAIHGPSAYSPLASAICFPVPSPPAAYFLAVEKVGKDTPKGTYPEGGSLWNPSPSARGLRPP